MTALYIGLRFPLAQFLRLLDLWEATIAARIEVLEGDEQRREYFAESYSAVLPPPEARESYEWNEDPDVRRPGWWRVTNTRRFELDRGAYQQHHRLLQAQGLLASVRLELDAQQREAKEGVELYAIPYDVRSLRDALAAFGVDPCEVP